MSRRAWVLVLIAVLAVAGAGVLVQHRAGDAADACPVATPELPSAAGELVAADRLVPAGSVGAERRRVVAAVNGLGEPFDEVASGRFYDGEELPSLVPVGDALGLATPSSLRVVSLPGGDQRWGRRLSGTATGGGLVGDRFVVLAREPRPALLTFDAATGQRIGCVEVPATSTQPATLLTDQSGSDVVVVSGQPGTPVRLSRADPVRGVTWQRDLDGVLEAGSVTVAGSDVLLGQARADPVRLAELATAGGIGGPMLMAYSLADGRPTWSYPAPDTADATAVGVVGHDDGSGATLALAVRRGGRSPARALSRLVALDDSGRELWHRLLGHGFWSGSLAGDSVVMQGPDAGGTQLRAYRLADGSPLWRVRSRSLPDRTGRHGFGAGIELGGQYVVPAPNGLVAVDVRDGSVRRLDSRVPVDQVLPLGDYLVVRCGRALLVLTRAVGATG